MALFVARDERRANARGLNTGAESATVRRSAVVGDLGEREMTARKLAARMLLGAVLAPAILTLSDPPAQASPGNSPLATMAEYNQIKSGMSYAQVVEIIGGPGTEMSSSDIGGIHTVMYMWQGVGVLGANMNAIFQNDKLVQKAQAGLR